VVTGTPTFLSNNDVKLVDAVGQGEVMDCRELWLAGRTISYGRAKQRACAGGPATGFRPPTHCRKQHSDELVQYRLEFRLGFVAMDILGGCALAIKGFLHARLNRSSPAGRLHLGFAGIPTDFPATFRTGLRRKEESDASADDGAAGE
jgi:hypothetical protein